MKIGVKSLLPSAFMSAEKDNERLARMKVCESGKVWATNGHALCLYSPEAEPSTMTKKEEKTDEAVYLAKDGVLDCRRALKSGEKRAKALAKKENRSVDPDSLVLETESDPSSEKIVWTDDSTTVTTNNSCEPHPLLQHILNDFTKDVFVSSGVNPKYLEQAAKQAQAVNAKAVEVRIPYTLEVAVVVGGKRVVLKGAVCDYEDDQKGIHYTLKDDVLNSEIVVVLKSNNNPIGVVSSSDKDSLTTIIMPVRRT